MGSKANESPDRLSKRTVPCYRKVKPRPQGACLRRKRSPGTPSGTKKCGETLRSSRRTLSFRPSRRLKVAFKDVND